LRFQLLNLLAPSLGILLLIINAGNTLLSQHRIHPLLPNLDFSQLGNNECGKKSIFLFSERVDTKQETSRVHLRQREFLAAAKERRCVLQQWNNFGFDRGDDGLFLLLRFCANNGARQQTCGFASEGFDEEVDTGTPQRLCGRCGCRLKV
jgi:hypothetical protein